MAKRVLVISIIVITMIASGNSVFAAGKTIQLGWQEDVIFFEVTNVKSQSVQSAEGDYPILHCDAPATVTFIGLDGKVDRDDGDIIANLTLFKDEKEVSITSVENDLIHGYAMSGNYGVSFIEEGSTLTFTSKGTYRIMFEVEAIEPSMIIVIDSDAPNSAKISGKPSSWAESQVNAMTEAGLVPQSLQSKYTQTMTRAEFCALAVTLYETVTGKEISERMLFNDTQNLDVMKAAAVGVVSGTGNNNFSPSNNLTREQAATMLASLANAVGKPLEGQSATFADNKDISSWAINSVGQMQAAGIMSGVGDNKFAPQAPYTREQSIVTIKKTIRFGKVIDSEVEVKFSLKDKYTE